MVKLVVQGISWKTYAVHGRKKMELRRRTRFTLVANPELAKQVGEAMVGNGTMPELRVVDWQRVSEFMGNYEIEGYRLRKLD